ncbi:similar to Saccharomyces cerevisiae YKL052C ASK1 Essential subunit of the Dam1 complex (aka DASH complex) [Maudiozyma saulgeensis]|uniref:DASH complex subunit ASK1 n=1 Tax=Maudiozyma saulgeensis TaxID=1789683 RepID=A0A1X7QX50_9SACH|nr:similar to Saccharomyces cerevisiae YKL052C ASK1 Essential subunit of the Dam1 complex (aka DASH complex) [Kazachstania saulgeensis]
MSEQERVVVEKEIEKLDQEITLRLQTIDSNFSYCFRKITQDIIPHVRQYSDICDRIIDNTAVLTTLFQESGNLTLHRNELEDTKIEKTKEPVQAVTTNIVPDTTTQEYHTANITSTGQILRLPDSSDDEDNDNNAELGTVTTHTTEQQDSMLTDIHDDSTTQRQSRKRKVSLLLQQEYGSSSSALPSPVTKYQKPAHSTTNSSPLKQSQANENDDTNDLLNVDSSQSSSS